MSFVFTKQKRNEWITAVFILYHIIHLHLFISRGKRRYQIYKKRKKKKEEKENIETNLTYLSHDVLLSTCNFIIIVIIILYTNIQYLSEYILSSSSSLSSLSTTIKLWQLLRQTRQFIQ